MVVDTCENRLDPKQLEATLRPFEQARSLPGAMYRDPDVYAAELESLFLKMWMCVGHESTLVEPGDYALREIGDESALIVRDGEGVTRAFHNVCRHRGTRLLDEGDGSGLDRIRCPYHAWAYGLDGELVAAPLMHEGADFKRADYPLRPIRLETWQGFLFINFDDEAPALDICLSDFPDVSRYAIDRLKLGSRHEYDIDANWKLLCENYGECYHCPTNHPQLNTVSDFRSGGDGFEGASFCGGPMRLNDGCTTMTMSGRSDRSPLAGLDARDHELTHYFNVYPTLLLSLHPDYVLTHTVWPVSVDRSRVVCEWLFAADEVEDPAFDASDAVEFWHTTNQQDWEICERAQKGVRARSYRPGPYSQMEETVYFFDRWYAGTISSFLQQWSHRADSNR